MISPPVPPSGNLVHVLIVSADEALRSSLRERLSKQRWIVREASSGTDALEKLEDPPTNILLFDSPLPDLRIAEFSQLVAARFPEVQQVPLHAHPPGLPAGLPLPDLGDSMLRPAASLRSPQSPSPAQTPSPSQGSWLGLVGSSSAMQRVFHAVRIVAPRETSVLRCRVEIDHPGVVPSRKWIAQVDLVALLLGSEPLR